MKDNNFISFNAIQDPAPEVTKEIAQKMRLLAHEGYFVDKMSLLQIISHGVDTRDWERDKQN